MKTRIYAAPAGKGLIKQIKKTIIMLSALRVNIFHTSEHIEAAWWRRMHAEHHALMHDTLRLGNT